MSTTSCTQTINLSTVTRDRLDGVRLTPELRPLVRRLAEAHDACVDASLRTSKATALRAKAGAAIVEASGALNGTLDVLADVLVGARMGTRADPFGARVPFSPSALKKLSHNAKATNVAALVVAIRAEKPSAGEVARAVADAKRANDALHAALGEASSAQSAFDAAVLVRDRAVTEWKGAYARFKRHARVAWENEPETFERVFAPLEPLRSKVGKGRRPAAAEPDAPAAPDKPSA